MAANYKISAEPTFYTDGPYAGKLKSVIFRAVSPTSTREWFAKNCGQFESAFARIMPASLAEIILSSLNHGDQVDFPGLYEESEFEQGFLFEWTPVYLIAPPTPFAEKTQA